MQSLFKLKSADQKFKGIIIAHDMTVSERQDFEKAFDKVPHHGLYGSTSCCISHGPIQ